METSTFQVISIPENSRAIRFSVSCRGTRLRDYENTFLWVRASGLGDDDSEGQPACIELVRKSFQLFESAEVPLGLLWLKPGDTCRIRATPEGLSCAEVRIDFPADADLRPTAPMSSTNRFTWIESPPLWLLILLLGLMAACALFSGRGGMR